MVSENSFNELIYTQASCQKHLKSDNFKTRKESHSNMIFLLFYFFNISQTLSGCNNIHPITKKSTCYENWQKRKDLKSGLQCCLSFQQGTLRKFDVPVIILQNFTPFNYKCLRSQSEPQCAPKLKCLPRNSNDLQGFFNFLDLLRAIPFEATSDHLNWNCFNTVDNFQMEKLLSKNISLKRATKFLAIENRLKQNFCRVVLFKYLTSQRRRWLHQDLCEHNFEIFPSHKSHKPKRFRVFNPLKQTFQPLCWVNDSSKLVCSYNSETYIQQKMNNSINIFLNNYQEWNELGISIQNDMFFFCGCFIR